MRFDEPDVTAESIARATGVIVGTGNPVLPTLHASAHEPARTGPGIIRNDEAPFAVFDCAVPVGERATLLGRFDTELEAAQFIETLPEYLTGRYALDGPADGDF